MAHTGKFYPVHHQRYISGAARWPFWLPKNYYWESGGSSGTIGGFLATASAFSDDGDPAPDNRQMRYDFDLGFWVPGVQQHFTFSQIPGVPEVRTHMRLEQDGDNLCIWEFTWPNDVECDVFPIIVPTYVKDPAIYLPGGFAGNVFAVGYP